MKQLRLAAIGCGGRSLTYMRMAAKMPDRYVNVAAADPNPQRLEQIRDVSGNPDLRFFEDDKAILAEPRLADIMIIGTQDNYHLKPCLQAMERGYDILLEKPIATTYRDVVELAEAATRLKRRVLVCHVLRYTPFYRAVKEIVDSGELGDIVSVNAREGVEAWHHTHSYVRGHWAVTETATPMIIAKSCHDMDILYWLIGRDCRSISSYGALSYFTEANKPEGAPARCTDGCPLGLDCPYNALHYLDSKRSWAGFVMDTTDASREEIRDWLTTSRWNRCVYQCDNNAVDHQVVSMRFDEEITATFTMTAFDSGRSIEIFGTRGRLLAGQSYKDVGAAEIQVIDHATHTVHPVEVDYSDGAYASHGGGDSGLMAALYDEMMRPSPADMTSSIQTSVVSHAMGFAAEESRVTGATVDLNEFRLRKGVSQ